LKNYIGKSPKDLRSGINSLEKQIAEHLMQQQADIFGIERYAIGIEDIDPEKELV